MSPITRLRRMLTTGLEAPTRQRFDRLLDALLRDLHYQSERENNAVGAAAARGWTRERVEVVLVLNAFHRIVIGPLEAAYTTSTKLGLGTKVPIRFGSTLRIDSQGGQPVRRAIREYHLLLVRRGLLFPYLNMTRVSDILYAMGSEDDER